jgi:hypothetical protein
MMTYQKGRWVVLLVLQGDAAALHLLDAHYAHHPAAGEDDFNHHHTQAGAPPAVCWQAIS